MSGESDRSGREGDNVNGDGKPDLETYLKEYKVEMDKMQKEMTEKAEKIALKEGALEKKVDPCVVMKIQDQMELVQTLMNKSKKEVKKIEVFFEKDDKDPSKLIEEPGKPSEAKEDQKKKSLKSKKKSNRPRIEKEMELNIKGDEYLMEVHKQVEMFLLGELHKKQKEVLSKFDEIIEHTNMIEKGVGQEPAAREEPREEEPLNIFDKIWGFITSFF